MAEVRVCVGVHSTEVVPSTVYFNHLVTIAGWRAKYELGFVGVERSVVAKARNFIVREARKMGFTHWLSLDTDHYIKNNLLPMLLENADAAMVSGLICKRGFPFETVAFKMMPNGVANNLVLEPDTGVHEVDGCAMGCTLLNLEMIAKLEEPWFYDSKGIRSDLKMCERLRAAGGRILVDTRTTVGHRLTPPIIWPETATEGRKQYIECHVNPAEVTEVDGGANAILQA